jgi:4-oxalocrotonate tautomerase
MPLVTISLYPGRTIEKKRQLVKAVTETLNRVLDSPPESVWVILEEVPKEHWAAAGVLASDR